MTEFLVIVLAFTQIPIMFIYTARIGLPLASYYCFRKNPEWLTIHPEFRRHTRINSVALGFSYLLAAASLLAAVKFVFVTPTPSYYVPLLVIPWLIWTLGYLVYVAIFYVAVVKVIPAPSIRTASLVDRRLSAYVSVWSVGLCYGLLALVLITYVWALISGTLVGELAIRRIIGLSIVVIIGTGVLLVLLRRKYSELEDVIGSHGRQVEVIGSVAVLYLGVFVGVYRILGDFFGISLFSDASFFVAISLLLQVFFLAYGLNPKVKSMLRDYSNNYLHNI